MFACSTASTTSCRPSRRASNLPRNWSAMRTPVNSTPMRALSHYLSTSADIATANWRAVACQMFQGSLDSLRRTLDSN